MFNSVDLYTCEYYVSFQREKLNNYPCLRTYCKLWRLFKVTTDNYNVWMCLDVCLADTHVCFYVHSPKYHLNKTKSHNIIHSIVTTVVLD
jgi:hypothetical protein